MAVNLAMSLKYKMPGSTIAVVTDSNDERLKKYFDIIIPINPDFGFALEQKLHIYEYSPFEETLYLDSDILIVRPFEFLFDIFKGQNVSTSGKKITDGRHWGMDIPFIMQKYDTKYIIVLNGGLFYFIKSEKSLAIFRKVVALLKEYNQIGADLWREGKIDDQPLFSIAMSIYGQEPIDDKGKGMRTPLGISGQFKMDILKGMCEFNKGNERVFPAIMHFGGECTKTFFYRREVRKLELGSRTMLPKFLISFFVNVGYNIPYTFYVFVYRIAKSVLKNKRFEVFPLMPMHRFE